MRIPRHPVSPCKTEKAFTDYLPSAASKTSYETDEAFQDDLKKAETMRTLPHRSVFSHGDFALHNIIVYDGQVPGIIDRECADWYAEYWDFTTPLRLLREGDARYDLIMRLGGDMYKDELTAERAIFPLTVRSWV